MPVSRATAAGLGQAMADHYGRAEVRLLRIMARSLAAGADSPRWAEDKLAELQLFRKRAQQVMASTTAAAVGELGGAAGTAYLRGAAAGEAELLAAGRRVDAPVEQAERAVAALVAAQADQLQGMELQVVRQASDAYRDAVVRASSGTLSGATTRLQDAQHALDDLARRGVSGFTDASGRRWGLDSYVDMATRTTTAQAAVIGHMDRLEQGGVSLFLVSASSRECELCRPWEGKVLSRGPSSALVPNVLTGAMERVEVDGTVAEATREGLFHPNCTHNLSGYLHGATRRGDATGNPEGYGEKAEQRRLERGVRHWRRREAASLTPEAKRRAQAKVREWQAKVAEHCRATGLPRKYHRESFDTGPRRDPGPAFVVRQGVRIPEDVAEQLRQLANGAAAVEKLDDAALEAELVTLMERGDFGPRYAEVEAELDRRDQGGVQQTLPEQPDQLAEQAALNRLLFGDSELRDLTGERRVSTKSRDELIREEYDQYVEALLFRADDACRGVLLSREGQRAGIDDRKLFTRELRDLRKWASPELQEFFAQPGNERLTFSDFRAMVVDDKKAREARRRRADRGYESEFG